jgi:hypothetical protein
MMRTLLTVSILLLFSTGLTAEAAVLQVGNNGLDGPGCGSKIAPCRSITRAIDLAAPGDTIVVGPGRYGDLDRDGTLGEANEEGPETGAVIVIDKAVTVESSTGAVWTIIDVAGFNRVAVRVTASGARFGRAKKGFTLFDSTGNGVAIESASNVAVEGNHAILTNGGFLASGTGGGHVIQGNVASANALGVALFSAGGGIALGNLAVANTGAGFVAGGDGSQRFEGNVALGNDSFGFDAGLHEEAVLVGNVAAGNQQGVFGGSGTTVTITGLAAIGNVQGGVHNQNTANMSLTASNLVGNGVKAIGGSANCGTINESFPLTVENVFWGAAGGPGDDPADDVCDLTTGSTTIGTIAPKPFKVKTKVPTF